MDKDLEGIISETECDSDDELLVDNSVVNGVDDLCVETTEEGLGE